MSNKCQQTPKWCLPFVHDFLRFCLCLLPMNFPMKVCKKRWTERMPNMLGECKRIRFMLFHRRYDFNKCMLSPMWAVVIHGRAAGWRTKCGPFLKNISLNNRFKSSGELLSSILVQQILDFMIGKTKIYKFCGFWTFELLGNLIYWFKYTKYFKTYYKKIMATSF